MKRAWVKLAAVVVALVVLAGAGYGVVHGRSGDGGTSQPAVTPTIVPTWNRYH